MSHPDPPDLTQLLFDLRSEVAGNPAAAGRTFELAHGELRRAAPALMRREWRNQTLQPTALVNEAYLRPVDGTRVEWQNRAHFFAGLTVEEVAHVLEVSRRTVQRERRVARMWLARELGGGGES